MRVDCAPEAAAESVVDESHSGLMMVLLWWRINIQLRCWAMLMFEGGEAVKGRCRC